MFGPFCWFITVWELVFAPFSEIIVRQAKMTIFFVFYRKFNYFFFFCIITSNCYDTICLWGYNSISLLHFFQVITKQQSIGVCGQGLEMCSDRIHMGLIVLPRLCSLNKMKKMFSIFCTIKWTSPWLKIDYQFVIFPLTEKQNAILQRK